MPSPRVPSQKVHPLRGILHHEYYAIYGRKAVSPPAREGCCLQLPLAASSTLIVSLDWCRTYGAPRADAHLESLSLPVLCDRARSAMPLVASMWRGVAPPWLPLGSGSRAAHLPGSRCHHHPRGLPQGSSRRLRPLARAGGSLALRPAVLLTNDDGYAAKGILGLAHELRERLAPAGIDVVVVAPLHEQSGQSMSFTIRGSMELKRVRHSGAPSDVRVYSLAGTPADCSESALDPDEGLFVRLGLFPILCVSGINLGRNVSGDVAYSGTVGAARQAALLGVPAISTSLEIKKGGGVKWNGLPGAISAVSDVVEHVLLGAALLPVTTPPRNYPRVFRKDVAEWPTRGRRHVPGTVSHAQTGGTAVESADERRQGLADVLDAFAGADVILNVNAPVDPAGGSVPPYAATRLGLLWYDNTLSVEDADEGGGNDPEEGMTFCRGRTGSIQMELLQGSDVHALSQGRCSVTTLQTWPEGHCYCMADTAMALALIQHPPTGLPAFLVPEAVHEDA